MRVPRSRLIVSARFTIRRPSPFTGAVRLSVREWTGPGATRRFLTAAGRTRRAGAGGAPYPDYERTGADMGVGRFLVVGLATLGILASAAAGALFWLMITRPVEATALVLGGN